MYEPKGFKLTGTNGRLLDHINELLIRSIDSRLFNSQWTGRRSAGICARRSPPLYSFIFVVAPSLDTDVV